MSWKGLRLLLLDRSRRGNLVLLLLLLLSLLLLLLLLSLLRVGLGRRKARSSLSTLAGHDSAKEIMGPVSYRWWGRLWRYRVLPVRRDLLPATALFEFAVKPTNLLFISANLSALPPVQPGLLDKLLLFDGAMRSFQLKHGLPDEFHLPNLLLNF